MFSHRSLQRIPADGGGRPDRVRGVHRVSSVPVSQVTVFVSEHDTERGVVRAGDRTPTSR